MIPHRGRFRIQIWIVKTIYQILLAFMFNVPVVAQTLIYRTYTSQDGLPDNFIQKTYQDSTGFIWISSMSGVSRYDGNRFQPLIAPNGIVRYVNALFEIEKNKILFAQTGGQVLLYQNGKITTVATNGTPEIYSFARYGTKLYVNTAEGIGEWRNNKLKIYGGNFSNLYVLTVMFPNVYLFSNTLTKLYLSDSTFKLISIDDFQWALL